MIRIHEELQESRLPNATTLSKLLETSTKTINRDITYMRDQLGLPVEWDAQANGYHYTSYVDGFPTVQISEGELFALLVAQKALEPYKDTPFQAPLESALQKLSDGLKDKIFYLARSSRYSHQFLNLPASPMLILRPFKS